MAVNRGVGVRQLSTTGTTPKEHRLTIAGMMAENAPGTPRSGLLNPASANIVYPKANMSYDVLACAAVILRDQDEGVYTPTTTGVTNVPTGNAPSSGSRWDIVWIKQNDPEKQDNDGGSPPVNLNTAIVRVTQGQAAASPVKPSIPAGAYALSEHQIFSGTTATNTSPNTSRQLWRYTVPRGAPIPVRNVSERSDITPSIGQQVSRLDLLGVLETWSGSAWCRGSSWVSVDTSDANWSYKGGIFVDQPPGSPVVRANLVLKLTRTGTTISNVTTTYIAAGRLIPAEVSPDGYGVTIPTVMNTSGGADAWGMVVRIGPDGRWFLRADAGSTSVNTGQIIPITASWVLTAPPA